MSTAKLIRETINVKSRTKRTTQQVIDDVCRFYRYDELPHDCYNAAYGVAWAIQTGRLSGTIVAEIESLSAYQFCGLIGEVADKCRVQNDVPRYLIAKFSSQ